MGKVCLVTGASSGIGRKIAERLLKVGHTVYGAARRVKRLKELESLGLRGLSLDLTDESSMKNAIKKIISDEGRIDVLINNAGVGFLSPILNAPIERVKEEFEVNLFGPVRLTQFVIPYMMERRSGRIINISSISAKVSIMMYGWYSASKSSMEMISDALRMELKPFGIDIVVVDPGAVKSEWYMNAIKTLFEMTEGTNYENVAKHIIENMVRRQKKLPSPDIVANIISRIVSVKNPAPRYIITNEAKLIMFLKWILPERIFWFILNNHFKKRW